jgi:16S rRNA (guanine966-N2)-methyltransferase
LTARWRAGYIPTVRIIAGVLGGRRIRAPRGDATRPTADRVREAVFNILAAMHPMGGARVLDLFAGSGALGLEALSRGAASVVAVDAGAEAVKLIAANARDLGMGDRLRVLRGDVRAILARARLAGPFDLVFLDPPYAAELASPALAALPPLLAVGAVVVVEHDRRAAPDPGPAPLTLVDRRRYGDTEVSFYRPAVAENPT